MNLNSCNDPGVMLSPGAITYPTQFLPSRGLGSPLNDSFLKVTLDEERFHAKTKFHYENEDTKEGDN